MSLMTVRQNILNSNIKITKIMSFRNHQLPRMNGSRLEVIQAMINGNNDSNDNQYGQQNGNHGEHGYNGYGQKQQQDCLQMIIQLDSQTSIPLKIHTYDNPLLLAKQFCYNNNIDPKVISILAKQIQNLQNKNQNRTNTSQIQSHLHSQINGSISRQASNKESRVRSTNKIGSYSSANNSMQTHIDKENKEYLANTNTNNNIQPNNIPNKTIQHRLSEQQLQLFNPDQNPSSTNRNPHRHKTNPHKQPNSTNTKYNSQNNTTIISNGNCIGGNVNANENNMGRGYRNQEDYGNGGVFDRLYRNSVGKNKRQLMLREKEKIMQSQQQLRNYQNYQTSTSKDGLNQSTMYGNNLSASNINHQSTSELNNRDCQVQLKIYEKNRKLQKQTYNRNQNLKQELEMLADEEYTGTPEINPLSRLIVEKMRQCRVRGGRNDEIEDLRDSCIRLYEAKDASKEKILARTIQYQKKKEEMEQQECTFHPKILKKSQLQALNTSRYLLLHEDFYIRESKAQSVKESQSKKMFKRQHPQINQISKKLVKDRTFTDRMVDYRVKAQKNKQRLDKQRKKLEPHQPEINKKSKNNKRGNISIGQYLYSKSLEKKMVLNDNSKEKSKNLVNKSSENMYQQMKKNAFRYIFTLMDSDEDGLISALKINILGLQAQVLQLLAPLLCQMEEVKIGLDQEEFVESLERLFNTFSIYQKNVILNVYKNPLRKSKPKQQPSFHPSLNQKSIEIAREVREPGASLYQLGRQKQMEREQKLSELRALKALIQFQQCTFHPNLFHHHH